MSLQHLIWCNLERWPRVNLPRISIVVNNSEQHNRSSDEEAEVHVGRIRIDHLPEEVEDEDD